MQSMMTDEGLLKAASRLGRWIFFTAFFVFFMLYTEPHPVNGRVFFGLSNYFAAIFHAGVILGMIGFLGEIGRIIRK